MRIYREEKRFNPTTGEETESQFTIAGSVCDFCGKRIDWDAEYTPEVSYQLKEIGGSEEVFYYLRLKNAKVPVDLYSHFQEQNEYVYCYDYDTLTSCENRLSVEWMIMLGWANEKAEAELAMIKKNLCLPDMRIDDPLTLAQVIYNARIRVIDRLLSDGVDPLTLGLISEEEYG